MATGIRALAFALTLTVPVTACGADNDEELAAAALKAEMVANAGMTNGRAVDDEQTSCIAHGAVDALGVVKLQEYELLTDDLRAGESIDGVTLAPKDADTMARVFAGCMDVEEMMERQIISGLDLPRRQRREAARCVRDRVTTDQVVSTMALEFQGAENPVFERLRADLQACLR
jgi:hypothetical protein